MCAKWLEDRRGLDLGRLGDLDRYVTIVAVVSQTLNIMQYLDEAVPSWPIV